MENKQLGIDNLKKACLAICKLAMKTDKALEDGRVTKLEYLGIAISGIKHLPFVFTHGSEIRKELEDLDPQELHEVIKYVNSTLDLREDKIKDIIEKGLLAVEAIIVFIKEFTNS